LKIQQTIKRQIEKWRGFFEWCTSWSGNLIKNSPFGNKFKNDFSKKGVEYF
jgi:hypothetical protein